MISNGEDKVDDKVYPLFFICLCSQHAIYFQFLRPLIGSYFMLFTQVIKTVLKEQYPLVLQKWSTGDFSELTPLSWASEVLVPFYFLYKQYILKRVSARKRKPTAIGGQALLKAWSGEGVERLKMEPWVPQDILHLGPYPLWYFSSSLPELCFSGYRTISSWFLPNFCIFGFLPVKPVWGWELHRYPREGDITLCLFCPCSLLLMLAGGLCPRVDLEWQGLLVWPSSYLPWRQRLLGNNIQLGLHPALSPWNWAFIYLGRISSPQRGTGVDPQSPVFPCSQWCLHTVFYFIHSFEGSVLWTMRLRHLGCGESYSQSLTSA